MLKEWNPLDEKNASQKHMLVVKSNLLGKKYTGTERKYACNNKKKKKYSEFF